MNEPEFSKAFSEFYRGMRYKWYFRNEPTPQFSEVPRFKINSLRKHLNNHSTIRKKFKHSRKGFISYL